MKLMYRVFSKWMPAVVLTVALVLSGCGNAAQEDADGTESRSGSVHTMQMATFWPSTAFQVAEGHTWWIQEIEKRTEGRVKIALHPGEALLGAREIYDGVASGVADIGVTCPAYTPGLFPLHAAFELPGYNNDNALVASMTVDEGYTQIRDSLGIDEFEDVKVLFFFATGPGNLMTNTPIRNLEEMAGKSIRTVGGTVPAIENLGATPVSMPMSEAYLALDQRIVQGILAPNEVLTAFRLSEVVRYVTETPFLYNVVFMQVMNRDTWNALPGDIQDVFEQVSKESAEFYGRLLTEHTRKGLEAAVQEHDVEVFRLPEAETARWNEKLEPIIEGWIQSTENAGLPGGSVYDIVRTLDERYSGLYR
jgi:TRAP-type transport system periplasmic protein